MPDNTDSSTPAPHQDGTFPVDGGFFLQTEQLQESISSALQHPNLQAIWSSEALQIKRYELADGLSVNYRSAPLEQAITLGLVPQELSLILRILIKGEFNQLAMDTYSKVPKVPQCHFHLIQPGELTGLSYTGEPMFEVVALYISIEKLASLLGSSLDQLPLSIQEFKVGCQKTASGHFLASRKALQSAKTVLEGFSDPNFSELFIKSKGTELLCLLFEDWKASEGHHSQPRNRYKLSTEDQQKLNAIYLDLQTSFLELQTIDALSRKAKLNRNKLHYGFKSLFGTTINHYQIQLRMEWAQQQILAKQHNISAISDQLNYRDLSTFSTAYRRFFGESPSDTAAKVSAG